MVPHQPYWEQQFPNDEPLQVYPAVPAHVPSVETLAAGDVAAGLLVAALVALTVGELPDPQVPKADWHPVEQ